MVTFLKCGASSSLPSGAAVVPFRARHSCEVWKPRIYNRRQWMSR
jgi:hypothetical protein